MPPSTHTVSDSAYPPMTLDPTEKPQSSSSSDEKDIEVDVAKIGDTQPGTDIADHDDYPDGGLRAWLVVLGTMFCAFSTFGLVNAWGAFQSYYETQLLKTSSPSKIAWIGSTQYALIFLPGQVTGRLFDLGHLKIPFLSGSVILVVATFGLLWEELACGMCFGSTWSVIGHWFKKRRGVATSIMAVGSSIGGTFFPIVTRRLIRIIGFPWTMRVIGFILIFTLGISNVVLARRLPPKNIPGGLFNFKVFTMPAFTIYCVANMVAFLGIYIVLTFIDVAAINVGVSEDFSFYLVSFANAGSGFGRLVTGVMVDKFGPINVITPMTIAVAIMTFIWPYATSKNSLIAVAIIYGFASSAYVSAFIIPLYSMGVIEDVGRRMGTVMVFVALGAIAGPPISGAINTTAGGTKFVSYYAGSTILFALLLMLIVRHLILKKLWGKF